MTMDPITPAAPPEAPRAPSGNTPEARRRAAEAFEGQVLGALLQPMFAGLENGGTFGGGAAEAQWRPMLVDEVAKALAKGGGLGIAAAVLRELDAGSRR